MGNGTTAYNTQDESAVSEAKNMEQAEILTNEELVAFSKASPEEIRSKWEPIIRERAEAIGTTYELAYSFTLNETSHLPVNVANISEAQFKQARDKARQEVAKLAVEAAGVGIGLAQAISANNKLKESKAPQFKAREKDFSQLDNLINEVRKKSSSEMPGRERERERDYDELIARASNTATEFGVQGAGFQQAAAVQASKGRRAGELDDEAISMKYTQLLGNLMGMKEEMMQNTDAQKERAFGRELSAFNMTEQALGRQKAAGIQNIYQAGSSLVEGAAALPSVLDVFQSTRLAVHKDKTARERAERDALAQERTTPQANIYR